MGLMETLTPAGVCSQKDPRIQNHPYSPQELFFIMQNIKYILKGRIRGMLNGTLTARFHVCQSLPGLGGQDAGQLGWLEAGGLL